MTNAPTDFDYAVVFEEQSTLNRLFARTFNSAFPTLNPQQFELVASNGDFVVILGLRSGMHFMADKTSKPNSSHIDYTRFAPARSSERMVTDWTWL